MKDDDEAVQEKFNSVVGKEMRVVDDLIDFFLPFYFSFFIK
jgi:hypothetical protein